MRSALGALALILVAAATNASGQPQPPTVGQNTVAPVTVTGRRAPDEDVIRSIITPFVASHAARDRKSGLLLRAPPEGVCPVALGLPQGFDDFVTRRIVDVARQVGAAVQPQGKCRPNVEILFTDRPQVIIDALARRTQGEILGLHFVHETRALVRVTRPVQAWYVTGTRGDGSSEEKRIDPNGDVETEHSHVRVDQAYGGGLDTGTGSLVPPTNHSQFINVLILVDAGKLAGREIGPVADYITLLALSQAQTLDSCSPLPSILDVFAAGCTSRAPPAALTDGDVAFLKALYISDLSNSGSFARTQVAHEMARDMASPPKP